MLLFEKMSSSKYDLSNQIKTRRTLVFWNTVAYVFSFFIPWVIFFLFQNSFVIPSQWRQNINEKCKNNDIDRETFFYANCFSDIGNISLVFGGIYGIAFSKANYKHLKFW